MFLGFAWFKLELGNSRGKSGLALHAYVRMTDILDGHRCSALNSCG